MLGEDTGEKPRQRGRKGGQRGQKAAKQASAPIERKDEVREDLSGSIAESVDAPIGGAAMSGEGVSIDEAGLADAPVVEPVSATEAASTAAAHESPPVNMQTIANAYRDFTRKSLQTNRSYLETMMGVRSLDKAVEIQTDFARQAYVNFVAESQKICGLYSELAKQTLKRRAG